MNKIALQQFLKTCGFNENFSLYEIKNGASCREYYRIRFESGGRRSSIILCEYKSNSPEEINNYKKVSLMLKQNEVSVPEIISVDDERGLVLLSDVGERDLQTELTDLYKNDEMEKANELLERAMQIIWKMQAIEPREPVISRIFDSDFLYAEIKFLKEKIDMICSHLKINISPHRDFWNFLKDICFALGNDTPKFFTHRDFHSENLICQNNASGDIVISVVDFQDARMGLSSYDVSSLLFDPYSNISFNTIENGIKFFNKHDFLSSKNQRPFFSQALQRLLKALGSYLFFIFEKRMTSYFNYLEPTLKRIEYTIRHGSFPNSCSDFIISMRHEILPALKKYLSEENH